MKTLLPVLVLVLHSLISLAQPAGKTSLLRGDFNGDGKPDEVFVYLPVGINNQSLTITYKLSNLAQPIEIVSQYDPSGFVYVVPIPDVVKLDTPRLRDQLFTALFGMGYQESSESVLQWYETVGNNRKSKPANKLVDWESKSSLQWEDGVIKARKTFATILAGNRVKALLPAGEKQYKRYMVAYYGNNHHKVTCSPGASAASLCTTDHAVILSKNGRQAWLFINDIALTGFGSEKLRNPSLVSARLYGNVAAICVTSYTNQSNVLYLADIVTGKIVRLNNTAFKIASIQDYAIDKGQLTITGGGKKQAVALLQLL